MNIFLWKKEKSECIGLFCPKGCGVHGVADIGFEGKITKKMKMGIEM